MALRRKLSTWKSMTKKNHMKAIDLSFLGKEERGGEGKEGREGRGGKGREGRKGREERGREGGEGREERENSKT